MSTINIFSAKDLPYGPLSNNYYCVFAKDGTEYPSVTNFIYSNMMIFPNNKNYLIQNTKTKEVKKEFENLYQKEIDTIIRTAIYESPIPGSNGTTQGALNQRFIQNKKLQQLLLDTGDSQIRYCSNDPLLGIGSDNLGRNEYGVLLQQLRLDLKKEIQDTTGKTISDNEKDILYDTYVAEIIIINKMEAGKDITNFLNNTPTEIINIVGRQNIQTEYPRDQILQLANTSNNIKRIIKNPITIARDVQARNIERIRKNRLQELKNSIFNMFVTNILEKKYKNIPETEYEKAINEQKNKLSWQKLNQLKNILCDDYSKIKQPLLEKIKHEIKDFNVPSLKQVEEAKEFKIKDTEPSDTTQESSVSDQTDFTLVFPALYEGIAPKNKDFVPLSLIATDDKMIHMSGKLFPSVYYYVLFKLFINLPSIKDKKNKVTLAYNKLLKNDNSKTESIDDFKDFNELYEIWKKTCSTEMNNNLIKYAKEGILLKFDNSKSLQRILLACTKNAKIEWGDIQDNILGIGSNPQIPGKNIVGKYLMELRGKYQKEHDNEVFSILTTKDITNIFTRHDKESQFMYKWIEMRVKDMCKALTTMKQYLFEKDGIKIMIDAKFTKTVLDELYQPCSYLFISASDIKADVPDFLTNMINKFLTTKKKKVGAGIDDLVRNRDSANRGVQKKVSDGLDDLNNMINKISPTSPSLSSSSGRSPTSQSLSFSSGRSATSPSLSPSSGHQDASATPVVVGDEVMSADRAAEVVEETMSTALVDDLIRRDASGGFEWPQGVAEDWGRQFPHDEIKEYMEKGDPSDPYTQAATIIWKRDRTGKKLPTRRRKKVPPSDSSKIEKSTRNKTDDEDDEDDEDIDTDVVIIIWQRISVLIYYLIEQIKDSTLKSIRCVIAQIEALTSKQKVCKYEIFNNENKWKNCIFNAIINLLIGIVKFNRKYSQKGDTLTKLDVYTAAKIIVNSDISNVIKKKCKKHTNSVF